MGLDMYLTRKFYVKNWAHRPPEERWSITINKGGKRVAIPTKKICYVETEEMYWRKANAIHQWFVKNIQEGKDDCGTYYVSSKQLEELANLADEVIKSCKLIPGKIQNGSQFSKVGGKLIEKKIMVKGKLIKNPEVAMRLLPTTSGFFFGSTEYNEWYYNDLVETRDALKKILKDKRAMKELGEFYYHSSW